ncbi:MAG: RNA-binding domain-containing protein [Fusobacteriota bacterium]
MLESDLKEIIDQGENASVEFKSKEVRPYSIAKEMVSFANSKGGVILIGINDKKEVEGIYNDFNYEEWLMNISRNNVIPELNIQVKKVSFKNKDIIYINVPKGLSKPYQTNRNEFLVRVGSTNRNASQQELLRLFQKSGFFHFDSTGVDGTSLRDLNMTKIDEYFSRYDVDFINEDKKEQTKLLKNTDIITEDNNLTVAGLLIFGINPQRYLMNSSISFARFKGEKIDSELLDKQVITGTIDTQIDTAFSLVKNNIKRPSDIMGTKRVDTKESYPDKVFRELLVNACVHRNYSILGSRIRIFFFDNRIEFINPGRLPNTITIEKLKAGVSYAVNPVIVKFMENLRYIDKLGRGLPMVYREAKKLGKEVIFEELGEEFKVTLYL